MSKQKWWISGDYTAEDCGEIIKEIREERLKFSQEDLAEAIGVKLVTLKSSENGKGTHASNVLRRICEKYNFKAEITIKT